MQKIDKAAQIRAERKARIARELDQVRLQFAANVRAAREAKGWSQMKLAEYCDLHVTAISKIERAASLSEIHNVVKMADSLGVSLEELRNGIGWTKTLGKEGNFAIEVTDARDHRRREPSAGG